MLIKKINYIFALVIKFKINETKDYAKGRAH